MTNDTANTCTIPMAALAAVAPFMGQRDVHSYLNGMLVQAARGATAGAAETGTRLVATDGHMALAVRHAEPGAQAWTGPDTIVPRALVEWALKQKGATTVTITRQGDGVTLEANGLRMTAPRIDATFPDWRAVFPQVQRDYAATGYDAGLIARICKAATAARKAGGVRRRTGQAVTIEPVGERSARFAFEMPDGLTARGVVMPMRGSAVDLDLTAVL